MAGFKLPKWQERILRRMSDLIGSIDFQKDITRVRSGELAVIDLIKMHDVPNRAESYLIHYIETGEEHNSLIMPPITLVSESDKTIGPSASFSKLMYKIQDNYHKLFNEPRVYLRLEPETTREELDAFVNQYWTSLIRVKLDLIQDKPNKPIRYRYSQFMHEKIYAANDSGLKPKQIVESTGIDLQNVRQVLYRRKKK